MRHQIEEGADRVGETANLEVAARLAQPLQAGQQRAAAGTVDELNLSQVEQHPGVERSSNLRMLSLNARLLLASRKSAGTATTVTPSTVSACSSMKPPSKALCSAAAGGSRPIFTIEEHFRGDCQLNCGGPTVSVPRPHAGRARPSVRRNHSRGQSHPDRRHPPERPASGRRLPRPHGYGRAQMTKRIVGGDHPAVGQAAGLPLPRAGQRPAPRATCETP